MINIFFFQILEPFMIINLFQYRSSSEYSSEENYPISIITLLNLILFNIFDPQFNSELFCENLWVCITTLDSYEPTLTCSNHIANANGSRKLYCLFDLDADGTFAYVRCLDNTKSTLISITSRFLEI